MTTADSTTLAELLEALREWLSNNPDGDLQDFAAEHDTTPQELAESWNTYFAQADFSRNYDLDTTTSQSGAQGATQAAAQAAPVYTPSSPPPYNASPEEYAQYLTQEVNNFQEFTTINNITNNIEDNSFNQQIIAGGDVDQDIDIDNSENTAEDGGVIIDDSELDDVNVNTGDVGEEGVLQQGDGNVANTGDVNASDGSAGSVFGDATTIGSGNDNFGSGQQGVNVAVGDGNQQANQQQDNETTIELDDVDVTGGDANADGGDGGVGGAGSGGDGGSGGEGGDGDGGFPFGPGGDGGDGGAGGAGGAGTGGSADGGAGGTAEGGDAGIDIDASNNQDIDF